MSSFSNGIEKMFAVAFAVRSCDPEVLFMLKLLFSSWGAEWGTADFWRRELADLQRQAQDIEELAWFAPSSRPDRDCRMRGRGAENGSRVAGIDAARGSA